MADNTGRWYAAHALILLSLALLVSAFVGVVDLARRSRPVLANVALIVFFPGLIASTAIVGMELVLWQMAQPEANRAEMISLLERLNGSAGIEPLFAVAVGLVPIGVQLLRQADEQRESAKAAPASAPSTA